MKIAALIVAILGLALSVSAYFTRAAPYYVTWRDSHSRTCPYCYKNNTVEIDERVKADALVDSLVPIHTWFERVGDDASIKLNGVPMILLREATLGTDPRHGFENDFVLVPETDLVPKYSLKNSSLPSLITLEEAQSVGFRLLAPILTFTVFAGLLILEFWPKPKSAPEADVDSEVEKELNRIRAAKR